jgi:hypothetical protein
VETGVLQSRRFTGPTVTFNPEIYRLNIPPPKSNQSIVCLCCLEIILARSATLAAYSRSGDARVTAGIVFGLVGWELAPLQDG